MNQENTDSPDDDDSLENPQITTATTRTITSNRFFIWAKKREGLCQYACHPSITMRTPTSNAQKATMPELM